MFIGNYTGSHNGHKVAQNAVLNRKLRCLRGLKTRRTENRQEKMVTTQATCKTFKVASPPVSVQCVMCQRLLSISSMVLHSGKCVKIFSGHLHSLNIQSI